MAEFLMESWEWLITLAFGFGTVLAGVRASVKALGSKIDTQTSQMNKRFDELTAKDNQHDETLAQHSNRLTAVERDVHHYSGWMSEMRDKINGLYERAFGKGN